MNALRTSDLIVTTRRAAYRPTALVETARDGPTWRRYFPQSPLAQANRKGTESRPYLAAFSSSSTVAEPTADKWLACGVTGLSNWKWVDTTACEGILM